MPDDSHFMQRALELARRGEGRVEPNPMVGCVIVSGDQIVGEGWHQAYGGPHAEVGALASADSRSAGATLYVTLEPCCHQGKTPPCHQAILDAGVGRVVVAVSDPFPQVAGEGIAALRSAGVPVDVGVDRDDAQRLLSPYLKRVTSGRPWVIAKWAMSLDGKIATATGSSKWISGEASRSVVQQLRGRVDAIVVGRRTAQTDDPLLIARPAGPRQAARVVVDSHASLSPESRLAQSTADAPVLVATGLDAPVDRIARLTDVGCEVFACAGDTPNERLLELLDELGRRRMTNVLVEGGGELLGSLLDLGQIDEVHAFIAPKLVGGADSPGPLAGKGLEPIAAARRIASPLVEILGEDVYLHGRLEP